MGRFLQTARFFCRIVEKENERTVYHKKTL